LELTIRLPQGSERFAVTGPAERNLKILREALGVNITARHEHLRVSGESRGVGQAAHVLEELAAAASKGRTIHRARLLEMIAAVTEVVPELPPPGEDIGGPTHGPADTPGVLPADVLDVFLPGKRVRPMTAGQRGYLEAIAQHDLTLCAGPAGTGKTYLATAAAVAMLKRGYARKLVLARPAVEAGEKLGFLPGTMQEKVNPYLRPLLDALHDMMEYEQIQRYMAADVIEIVPLAFMRGRTLNDACIILDEAQNTTANQMLMFLTRLGHGSKMIVTGDTSQIDLEDPRDSGLVDAARRLRRVAGVAMVTLAGGDIVRHNLVQKIVEAYGERGVKPQAPVFEAVTAGPAGSGNRGDFGGGGEG
jgi:phosphate starvation-inducible PhoH-like protein